ncbi:PREDICTED: pentatricopeptide repeat-containing protein At3g48250, chloroplastic-like [Camelina sativa]|uniref:Pentatricopeptide repeat-containing protein At3g48250, chloroplastic-like n=1 Tax=Camelina sativa TaxID=90675 RepID=A0ABM0TH15_CAMSA|nr:PREDICTED: pentatricopeptide repeat-containing protein At3g48250, chloroplastic-like [Camelina sativa]
MYRSKAILSSIRNAYSQISTRSYLSRAQVGISSNSSSPLDSFAIPSRFQWQYRTFTLKPDSMLQLVMENDWSKEVEEGLRKPDMSLTHETAIYVLRKLEKSPDKAYCFIDWVLRDSGLSPSSPLYSIMLRILAQQRSMKRFWMTLSEMKQGGFYLDEDTYKTVYSELNKPESKADAVAVAHFYERMLKDNATYVVAKNVSAAVLKVDWGCEVERELQEMKLVLSDTFVIRVLKELRDHPLKALAFFHWVGGSSSGYQHSTVTYNAALRVLARPNSVTEFWSVVDEMKTAGHEMDLDTYIKVSRQFQKSRLMTEAVKLYEFMMDGPFKPSIQDCSLLLRSLSAGPNPDLDLVFRVSRKYESTGSSLSKAVYDGIHRSLTSVGRFEEAEEIVKAMRNKSYEPDNITYSQLVFGLCKAKRLEEARGVLDQMEAQGCYPDIKTWTILIQGHCKNNELDKAFACFANMLEKGFDIDSDLLDVLIDGFLIQSRIEGACKFLMEMVRNANVRPWQSTYKTLIDKLLEIKKGEEALDLLQMMKKQNYPAYAEAFDGYLAKFGTLEDAKKFLDVLSSKDSPSFAAYYHVIEAFYREGRLTDAKNLLFICPHHFKTHPKISELFGAAA